MPGSRRPGVPAVPARAGRAAVIAAATAVTLLAGPVNGQQRPGQIAPPAARTGGVIIGTVLDAVTGRGLPGVKVTLRGPNANFAILTDPLGRYYFVALAEGDYEISAQARGYTDGRYGRTRAGGAAQPLALAADQWRVDANILMWELAAIEGVVTDEAGEGITGVRVHALRRDHDAAGPVIAEIVTALTDDRGHFRLGGLTPGSYLVMTPSVQATIPMDVMNNIAQTGRSGGGITAMMGVLDARAPDEEGPGRLAAENIVPVSDDLLSMRGRVAEPPPAADGTKFVYAAQYYPATDIPSLAVEIDLDPGAQYFGAAFLLRPVPARDVRGVVTGPDGPVANELLRLVPDSGEDFGAGFEAARTISNLEGEFIFLDVPAGSYRLEARHIGSFNELSPRPFVSAGEAAAETRGEDWPGPPADQWWARQPVSVFADDVEGLALRLQPTLSVLGQIAFESTTGTPRDSDMSQIRVSLKPAGGGRAGVRPVRPRESGAFALHGLWPLRYYIDVTLPRGWAVLSVQGQGRDLTSDPIDAADAAGDIAVAVRLTRAVTEIRGTVRDRTGRPAADMAVLVIPADRQDFPPLRTREARASSRGEYIVRGLPPGRYDVVALTAEELADWRAPGAIGPLLARARGLSLAAGEYRLQDLVAGR